jgi:hypothetical protein
MKTSRDYIFVISLILVSVLFASCGNLRASVIQTNSTLAGNQSTVSAGGAKVLVLEASYRPGTQPNKVAPYDVNPVLNNTSNTCLSCHGPTYEDLREKTVDYQYAPNEIVQPHAYLEMSKANPHASTLAIDCLTCHTQHDLPTPLAAVRKANLNYCINCHHSRDLIACSECHP